MSELLYEYNSDWFWGCCSFQKTRIFDVAIFEYSASEEFAVDGHLIPSLAGKIAQQAGVKKLVLSHIYPMTDTFPLYERCKKVFDREVIVVHDFLCVDI